MKKNLLLIVTFLLLIFCKVTVHAGHQHSDSCYTITYHSHTGDSSTYGGCYTIPVTCGGNISSRSTDTYCTNATVLSEFGYLYDPGTETLSSRQGYHTRVSELEEVNKKDSPVLKIIGIILLCMAAIVAVGFGLFLLLFSGSAIIIDKNTDIKLGKTKIKKSGNHFEA